MQDGLHSSIVHLHVPPVDRSGASGIAARARSRYVPGPGLGEVEGGASLGRGASGEGVRALQRLLNAAGASPPLAADGLFGPRTEAALRALAGAATLDADALARLRAHAGARGHAPRATAAPHVEDRPPSGSVPARALPRPEPPPRSTRPSAPPGASSTPASSAPASSAPASSAPASSAPASSAPASSAPASSAPASARSSAASLALPPRPASARGGAELVAYLRTLPERDREAAIEREILSGNVPESSRRLREIDVETRGRDGQVHRGRLRVMPDYLAIGSDADHVRVPLRPSTAQRIADATHTTLPTRRIVDEVHRQAEVRVPPRPMSAARGALGTIEAHSRAVDAQLEAAGARPGQLVSGDQKDVVVSNAVARAYRQGRDPVAIYGWHQSNGAPIQPLSTVHSAGYTDYSHGVRLVGATMQVDGRERPVAEVLADPDLAGLLSDEGPIRSPRYRT